MKNNSALIALTIALLILTFVMYRIRVNNSKKQQSVESAIKSFDGQHIPYDSAYAKNDTVSFYNNGAPVGMTVSTTE